MTKKITIDADVIWDLEDNTEGNVQHIAQHNVTVHEVEDMLYDSASTTQASRSSGLPITFGWTRGNRYLAVVWEHVGDDPLTIYPVTAYDVPPPAR